MLSHLDRLVADLGREIGAMTLAGPRARAALRSTLAVILSVLAALVLDLDDPWWAGITGLVLVQTTATATWAKSVDRVIGTLAGALIGLVAASTIQHHALFELVCLVTAAVTLYGYERVEHAYAILLGGVTVFLVLFGSLETPDQALHLAVYRALEVTLGVVVTRGVDWALEPGAQPSLATLSKPGLFALPIDRELAAIALAGGVTIAIIPLVWDGLQLPGLDQTPITAFVVVSALRRSPGRKGLLRALGCLLGGAYGLVAMHVVGDHFLPWLVALAIGIFIGANLSHGDSNVIYVGLQAGFATILAMVQGSGPSSDILPALDRLAGIFGGIVLVAVGIPVLYPPVRRMLDWLLGPAPRTA